LLYFLLPNQLLIFLIFLSCFSTNIA
jgi:hypothetical protein